MSNPLQNAGAATQAAVQNGSITPHGVVEPGLFPDDNFSTEEAVPASQAGLPLGGMEGAATPATTSIGAPGGITTPATNNIFSSDTETQGEDLFESVTQLCTFADMESNQLSSGNNVKIDCFFVDKLDLSNKNAIHFKYGLEVKGFSINKSISQYGTTGTIELVDVNGILPYIIEKQSTFYCVIGIFEISKSSTDIIPIETYGGWQYEHGYIYQPYIFEIEEAKIISPDSSKNKIYKIDLLDIVSAALKKITYGNLILQYPTFINSQHFGEVYQTILDYAGLIINLNHNKKYKIDTKINFSDDIEDSINEIIKNVVLKDFPIDSNVYNLLNHVYTHAAREIEPPASFTGDKPGNILIPILLQDEFEDISGIYRKYFKRDMELSLSKLFHFHSDSRWVAGDMIKRGFYLKGISMPFELAFKLNPEQSIIYESINPKTTENGLDPVEQKFLCMNGFSFQPIKDSIEIPPSSQFTGLSLKNLSLLSDTTGGSSNMLIYFNWIFEYYKAAFLNGDDNILNALLNKKIVPNMDPHFHTLENGSDVDQESFAKMNSVTIKTKSNDAVKEALYYVGRTLKSYVFLNSLFGFKIKANLFRHPGEIIKIGNEESKGESESPVSNLGGLNAVLTGFSMAFMTHVTHIFRGSLAEDIIYATKVCDFES